MGESELNLSCHRRTLCSMGFCWLVVCIQASHVKAQSYLPKIASFDLRAESGQILGPFSFANGQQLRVGAENYVIVLPKRGGVVRYKDGKSREFSSVIGIDYSYKDGRAHPTTDLVIGSPDNGSVIAFDKIAKISAWEKTVNQVYTSGIEIVLVDGKTEKFSGMAGILEIEWADSLVRTRTHTSHFVGGSLEFEKSKK